LDIRGHVSVLVQANPVWPVPFLVSSGGYGLLWGNTAPSRFGDLRPFEPILPGSLVELTKQAGGLGWEGQLVAPVTGEYQFQAYSNGATRVWLAGVLRID